MEIVEQVTGKGEIRYQVHTTAQLAVSQVIVTTVFLFLVLVYSRDYQTIENVYGFFLVMGAFGLFAVLNLRALLVGLRTVTITTHELVLQYRDRVEHLPLSGMEILATKRRKKKDTIRGYVLYRVSGGKQRSLRFDFSKPHGVEAFVFFEHLKQQNPV